MKRIIIPVIFNCLLFAAISAQTQSADEFKQMKEITRIATSSLSGKDSRVVFASENNLESMLLRRWIVTVNSYPGNYRTSLAVMSGPPCMSPEIIKEACSVQEIAGEPLFLGKFEATGRLHSFAGRTAAAAQKELIFQKNLKAHPGWTQRELEETLASEGAKYGPAKKKEFMATLPLRSLAKLFGPMRIKDISTMPAVSGQQWPAYWRVRTVMIRNPQAGLVMYFEPFDGELQLLHLTGSYKVWDPVTKAFKWEHQDE